MIIKQKSAGITLLILLLFTGILASAQESILRYTDEVIGMLSILYIITIMLSSKIRKTDKKVVISLLAVCIIGLVGNFISRTSTNIFAIFVDLLGVVKVLAAFIFVSHYLSKDEAKSVTYILSGVSKLFLIIGTAFGLLSLFVDLGMGSEVRYGIASFRFIFPHVHEFAILSLCALMIIIEANQDKLKVVYFYTALTIICEMLTTKGASFIWCFIIILLYFYYFRNRRIRFGIILLIVGVAVLIGRYQITTYILNDSAPRAILIKYGFITANRRFPFGAGFATYGSEMAHRYYSNLYYEYEFYTHWGLSPAQGQFLNDNYWPMIIGEFGYLGMMIMASVYWIIFREIQDVSDNKAVKVGIVSAFIYIMVHSLGSASLTSAEGQLLFTVFGILVAASHEDLDCLEHHGLRRHIAGET